MTLRWFPSTLLLCVTSLAAGWILGHTQMPCASLCQNAATQRPSYGMREKLGASLYMQTAAEYRACCLQTYRLAALRLESLLAAKKPGPKKPAVVMDLDETIFDNAAFESYLFETRQEHADQWEYYEQFYANRVTFVPGAKEFIAEAEAKGTTIVYLSNRTETHRQGTIDALVQLGLNVNKIDERLWLKQGGQSDKTARRAAVAARYDVLLYCGDNLRDFSDVFASPKLLATDGVEVYRKAIQARFQQVDETASHWGNDWIIWPNPMYGEWERLVRKNEPEKMLRPSGMHPPGAQ
jgi:5'-nucleotidase (lipoprotein e(P4) family)